MARGVPMSPTQLNAMLNQRKFDLGIKGGPQMSSPTPVINTYYPLRSPNTLRHRGQGWVSHGGTTSNKLPAVIPKTQGFNLQGKPYTPHANLPAVIPQTTQKLGMDWGGLGKATKSALKWGGGLLAGGAATVPLIEASKNYMPIEDIALDFQVEVLRNAPLKIQADGRTTLQHFIEKFGYGAVPKDIRKNIGTEGLLEDRAIFYGGL